MHAQSSADGALVGRVLGSGDAPLQARVSARAAETGVVTETRSTRTGDYVVAHLPAGEYTIEVSVPGLAARRRDHIAVTAGEATQLRDDLSPARPSHEDGPPEEASAGDAERVNSEANPDSEEEGEGAPSLRGLPPTQNDLRVDGGEATQTFGGVPAGGGSPLDAENTEETEGSGIGDGGATGRSSGERSVRSASAPFTFAHGAIREFRLSGETFSALYGSTPGGVLTVVTRGGGTEFHGSVTFRLRNSALAATDPYSVATSYADGAIVSGMVKPHDARERIGVSVGGPMLRRPEGRRGLFFFAALEVQRRSFPAISSPQDPNFYALTPTQSALLANRGVTLAAVNHALDYLNSLSGETPRRADGSAAFLRIDAHPAARLTTSLEGTRARWNQPAGALSAPVVSRARASLGNSLTHVDTFLSRNVVTLTPFLSNELRVGYSRDLQAQTAQTPLPQEPGIGLGGLPPEVAIGPQGFTFGTPANLGRTAYPDERRVQVGDLISLVRGRHHLQGGGDLSAVHTFVSALANQQGTFRYDSLLTRRGRAGGLVDWITDQTFNVNTYPNGACPSIAAVDHLFCFRSFTQSFGAQEVSFDTKDFAGFVEDDVRLPLRLTVQAGMRYDYTLLPVPQNPNPGLDSLLPGAGATSVFPEDRNNVAPRVGLAWQASRRTTVRAGYGIFFGRLPGATIRAALLNTDLPTSTTHVRIVPGTTTGCPQVQNQGFGYPCAYLASPAAALPNATSATIFARRFRLPAVQQASATVEQEFPGRVTASLTYRMNLDHQLPNSVDANIAPSTRTMTYQLQGGAGAAGVQDGETFALPVYTQRRTTAVGPVSAISSASNATYHGLTLEARRATGQLSLRGSVTFSRAIDFNPTQGAVPRVDTQLDPFDLRYDKGLSSLNFPVRLVLDGVWRPAVVSGRREVRAALNGWSVAPVFVQRSGAPFSYRLSGGTRLPGGTESVNGSGGAVYLPTVGRNTLRLPAAATVDLRVTRSLRMRDRMHLALEAEAYNLANHVNVSGVTERAYLVGAPVAGVTPLVFQNAANLAAEGLNERPFGTFTDAGTSQARARQVEFGLRLNF